MDYTIFFNTITRAEDGSHDGRSAIAALESETLKLWFEDWESMRDNSGISKETGTSAMRSANPVRIARNHQVEKAIQLSEAGNKTAFVSLLAAVKNPFEESEQFSEYELPPLDSELVCETYCGT